MEPNDVITLNMTVHVTITTDGREIVGVVKRTQATQTTDDQKIAPTLTNKQNNDTSCSGDFLRDWLADGVVHPPRFGDNKKRLTAAAGDYSSLHSTSDELTTNDDFHRELSKASSVLSSYSVVVGDSSICHSGDAMDPVIRHFAAAEDRTAHVEENTEEMQLIRTSKDRQRMTEINQRKEYAAGDHVVGDSNCSLEELKTAHLCTDETNQRTGAAVSPKKHDWADCSLLSSVLSPYSVVLTDSEIDQSHRDDNEEVAPVIRRRSSLSESRSEEDVTQTENLEQDERVQSTVMVSERIRCGSGTTAMTPTAASGLTTPSSFTGTQSDVPRTSITATRTTTGGSSLTLLSPKSCHLVEQFQRMKISSATSWSCGGEGSVTVSPPTQDDQRWPMLSDGEDGSMVVVIDSSPRHSSSVTVPQPSTDLSTLHSDESSITDRQLVDEETATEKSAVPVKKQPSIHSMHCPHSHFNQMNRSPPTTNRISSARQKRNY